MHSLAVGDAERVPALADVWHGFGRAGGLGPRSPSLRIPDPAFQVYPLAAYEPWMTGTFAYSEPRWARDCVGLR